jgi:3-methyladenine DNA glycosylase AlkD
VNNWNLVDASAHLIIGEHLLTRNKNLLKTLAKSTNLWERRIAIVATQQFIRNDNLTWTLQIAKILLADDHDLIHKAVGWMLREVGKKDVKVLTDFLDKFTYKMPRTMLRYAIERLPKETRKFYLKNGTNDE